MGTLMFMLLVAVILFAGLFVGLLGSYRDTEAERTRAAAAGKQAEPSNFFGWRGGDTSVLERLLLRRLENHLRREVEAAEQFVDNPRPETLRAGCQSRVELH